VPGAIEIAIESLRPIEAVRFECTDLTGNTTKSVQLNVFAPLDGVACSTGGHPAHHVKLRTVDFPDGIWSAQAYCRLSGMTGFRPLQEDTGERYTLSFQVRDSAFIERIDPHALADPEQAFLCAGRELRSPVAASIVDTMRLAENLYIVAGRRLLDGDREAAARAFASDLVIDDAFADSPGFVPIASPFSVTESAFSAPAWVYAAVPSSAEFASFSGLAALSRAKMVKDALANPQFHGAVACAFTNAASAQRVAGLDLTGFDFGPLVKILMACNDEFDDDPKLLGRAFFAACQRRAAIGLAMAYANPANGTRVGRAMFVAKQSLHAAGDLTRTAAALADGTNAYPKGVPYVAPEEREENESGGLESLFGFLSALALAARLDARGTRCLPSFLQAIKQTVARFDGDLMDAEVTAGICVRIAPQYFAAHLLFWELLIRSKEPHD
jgi:hypothetical protein